MLQVTDAVQSGRVFVNVIKYIPMCVFNLVGKGRPAINGIILGQWECTTFGGDTPATTL